ncbi:uncharacterized protein LOC125377963 [Haliotis rufescens]|uniref:uncharacterized protein LOC125377963 n=1 Tax=Haliotis rufescens TaxID=6454 RepID=UPI00201EF06C|nr:uncharacterized protein LOC125377963 [Haliotis rufescens]
MNASEQGFDLFNFSFLSPPSEDSFHGLPSRPGVFTSTPRPSGFTPGSQTLIDVGMNASSANMFPQSNSGYPSFWDQNVIIPRDVSTQAVDHSRRSVRFDIPVDVSEGDRLPYRVNPIVGGSIYPSSQSNRQVDRLDSTLCSDFRGRHGRPREGTSSRFLSDGNERIPSRNFKMTRREKQPDTFDGKTSDWQDYMVHFEQVTNWNGWNEQEKAQQLSMSLRGAAQKMLSSLTFGQLGDYNAIRNVLQQRFNPRERSVAYRCEFRNRRQEKDESVTDYGYQLRRLALLAYPEVPYMALEMQIIDQFVNGLTSFEMKKKVTFSHPHTLDEAISSALEYEAMEGNRARKPVEGKVSVVQSSPDQEHREKRNSEVGLGDILKLIEEKFKTLEGSNGQSRLRQKGCFYCQEKDHFRDYCPKLLAKLTKNLALTEQTEGRSENI